MIGAPDVWDGLNSLHSKGIKIAVIDTGIELHARRLRRLGRSAAYQTAGRPTPCAGKRPRIRPSAPKVKGGCDFVGNSYDPSDDPNAPESTPHPDPNPLDCNDHGTHTAGTMAGFGVLANGHTYTGPYNAATVDGNSWFVGPGVAPKADIYALKVFGCQGGTNEVIDAIDWAVENNMDVINMSLGSPFGSADSPDAEAAENAAHDGVIVVTSSGNEGSNPYMTGTPGSGNDVISTAANDGTESTPAVLMGLSSGNQVTAQNSNGLTPLPSSALHVLVLKTPTGGVSFGCFASDYPAGGVSPNTAVVVLRGGRVGGTACARAHKAILGQQAGAAAVVMLNVVSRRRGRTTTRRSTGRSRRIRTRASFTW